MNKSKEWFGEWFDSPYYHILYKNRDHQEAQLFVDNLVKYLPIASGDRVLDLACGKGRHAIYLHKLGIEVTGVDLSVKSIAFANRFKRIFGNEKLSFFVHDMREVFALEEFDFVLNIFTSFGYFDKAGENQRAIHAAATALKPEGRFVLDFFNTEKVINSLVPYEKKTVEGIDFVIERKLEGSFIKKHISFSDNGKEYRFKEKVKTITYKDFLKYFNAAGLKVVDFFGDYRLNNFDPETSERMIFITRK